MGSQDVDEASRDPVNGQNLAYMIHFYANTHRGELRNKVSAALSNGVAVFATEWGTCSADGNGQLDLGETQAGRAAGRAQCHHNLAFLPWGRKCQCTGHNLKLSRDTI